MGRRQFLFVGVVCIAAFCAGAAEAEIRIATAGPMTGAYAWFGEQYQRGAGMAVEDLNARGGVLGGQRVELIVGDDFCDPDQAVALARKLVSDGVVFVAGHWCSHSSIPVSKVYEEAEILVIAPGAISSKLTDEGGPNVFRVCGRDDRQGTKVADYLAEHWTGKKIAILDDGTTFGTGPRSMLLTGGSTDWTRASRVSSPPTPGWYRQSRWRRRGCGNCCGPTRAHRFLDRLGAELRLGGAADRPGDAQVAGGP